MTALCRRLDNSPLPYYVQKQHQILVQLELRLNSGLQKNSKMPIISLVDYVEN